MPTITFYTKPNCPLCDHARHYLQQVLAAQPDPAAWPVDEISILDDPDLFALYRYVIPVVVVGDGPPLVAPASLDVERLRQAVGATAAQPAAPSLADVAPPMAGPAPAIAVQAAPPAPPPATPAPAYPYYYGNGARPRGILGAIER